MELARSKPQVPLALHTEIACKRTRLNSSAIAVTRKGSKSDGSDTDLGSNCQSREMMGRFIGWVVRIGKFDSFPIFGVVA